MSDELSETAVVVGAALLINIVGHAPQGVHGIVACAALEARGVSDEIWVASGTYEENILMEPGVAIYGGFGGTETVRSERNSEANETIIDATGLNTSAVVAADFTILDGFTVTGGNSRLGGGVFCYDCSVTLAH